MFYTPHPPEKGLAEEQGNHTGDGNKNTEAEITPPFPVFRNFQNKSILFLEMDQ